WPSWRVPGAGWKSTPLLRCGCSASMRRTCGSRERRVQR
ncbi:MAG: hypothetical protein AVDCRST_MAG77-4522, partial [uncultured Chloroflexi bacterium]